MWEGALENVPKYEKKQHQLSDIGHENRDVEGQRIEPSRHPIVDGVQRRHNRSIGLVRGKRAESRGIGKERRKVPDVPDGRVIHDDVGVIEVKAVPEMVRVPSQGDDEDTSLHVEAFYQYQVTDNIAITPGVVWVTAPDNNEGNEDLIIGTIRTTFTF